MYWQFGDTMYYTMHCRLGEEAVCNLKHFSETTKESDAIVLRNDYFPTAA